MNIHLICQLSKRGLSKFPAQPTKISVFPKNTQVFLKLGSSQQHNKSWNAVAQPQKTRTRNRVNLTEHGTPNIFNKKQVLHCSSTRKRWIVQLIVRKMPSSYNLVAWIFRVWFVLPTMKCGSCASKKPLQVEIGIEDNNILFHFLTNSINVILFSSFV